MLSSQKCNVTNHGFAHYQKIAKLITKNVDWKKKDVI